MRVCFPLARNSATGPPGFTSGRPQCNLASMANVYIETSIVSYLAGRTSRDLLIAACQQATRDWWNTHRLRHALFTSRLVLAEAGAGDVSAAQVRLRYLEGIPALQVTNESGELARALIEGNALPQKAEADSLHIAIAAVHGLDLLLTWNCRHIDNPVNKPVIRSVCVAAGYRCPEICTPLELLEGTADEE